MTESSTPAVAPGLGWPVLRAVVVPTDVTTRAGAGAFDTPDGVADSGRPTGLGWPTFALGSVSEAVSRETSRTSDAGAEVSRETPPFERSESGETDTPPVPETDTPPTSAADLPSPVPETDTPLARQLAQEISRKSALQGKRLPRPARPRVLTVANQKGGVGKTTTTVNLAAALAQAGLRVLVIDADPQGNASTALSIDHHAGVPSVYDVLVDGKALTEVLQQAPGLPGLWCAPATIDLAGAEIELVSLVARETRLARAIQAYRRGNDGVTQPLPADRVAFDYILIDCPPSLGLLTVNAFVAAEEVLIPIQCEYYALEGLSQLLQNIEMIRSHLNPDLHVSTILLTMYDGRTRLASQVAEDVRAHFPDQVLRASVPRSVRISEAPSHGQTVITYDPSSSGALSYLEAASELAERGAALA